MHRKEPKRWTELVVLISIINIIIAASISPIVMAFPPINAPSSVKTILTNITKSENGSTLGSSPITQDKTGFAKKQVPISIAGGSDSPANNKFYVPSVLNVSRGDTVLWKNEDTTLHTVTSGSPGTTNLGAEFDSNYLAAGKTFKHTFNKGGTFDYFCTLHPFMTGEITVSLSQS